MFLGEDDLHDKIDLIICLGGDGTLIYVSSLFQVCGAFRYRKALHVHTKMIYTREEQIIIIIIFDIILFLYHIIFVLLYYYIICIDIIILLLYYSYFVIILDL